MSMRRNAVSHIRDAISLPFLFETRTILRLPCQTQVRTLSGSTSLCGQSTGERNAPSDTNPASFLRTKAATSKSKPKGTNVGTSITAAERRVFNDIFNQVAGQKPSKAANGPQEKRDHFLDHEGILSIFSSAVSRHVEEQKARTESEDGEASDKLRKRALDRILAREEEVLQRYPKPLRRAARRATAAALSAQESGTMEDLVSGIATRAPQTSEVPGHITHGESDQSQGGDARAKSAELDGQRKDLDKEMESSTSDGKVDTAKAPLSEFRPSFLVANEKDENLGRALRVSSLSQSKDGNEEKNRTGLHKNLQGLGSSVARGGHPEAYFRNGLRPSFLTNEKRAEDVASFAEHYGTVRPSFIRKAEDAAVVKEKLQHDPESVFQGTIHRYCREEMEKIANSFQRAFQRNGDVGIWNTCLAMVFPMIELLDKSLRKEKNLGGKKLLQRMKDQDPVPKTSSDMPDEDAPKASLALSREESPLLDLPPYVPPLYIISRLYPAALLLAFRLLRTKSPTSPLALALLPQIRSLGPTSYVLGASTEFYNALIELRWDVYSDLQGVDGLLTEMERSGVAFDVGTWNILVKIGDERVTDLRDADRGTRGAGFWGRPLNLRWFQKVAVEWKMVVAERLREHGLDADVTEREYGAGGPPESGAVDTEQTTVWL